jgi:hypothetical protein
VVAVTGRNWVAMGSAMFELEDDGAVSVSLWQGANSALLTPEQVAKLVAWLIANGVRP